ncbi:DUF4893 domain-containing protein [Sphingomonas ginkgonis]|uniref:DUF4893 domain-containing protein n=1 Tax=Sphingomonas ginkgonis TaxID=2315330 RepID=A0A429VBP2_9SPHN|nr:DUF4893 domain-containing protein [Sphingomonas ginkgonis]RST31405.1 DUF4893 domain-containing protein [Sphingomonas ginkgonis]
MIRKSLILPVLGLLLQACASTGSGRIIAHPSSDWRAAATPQDRERLRNWRSTWLQALAQARAAGHGAEIASEGRLLQPDAALGGAIRNGTYQCRLIKLGARSPGGVTFVSYPRFGCEVRQERQLQGFAKLSGTQRQVGLIFPGDPLRQVFLGTLLFSDESRAMQYGWDQERDVVGFVERIGPGRYRLAMPSPRFDSLFDVIELSAS